MISTGTDVKPIECVFFLRNVKSAGFFEQMKGPRRARDLARQAAQRDAERQAEGPFFIIVDAVGVCEQDKTDSLTLNRQPTKTLEEVLTYVAQGGLDPMR